MRRSANEPGDLVPVIEGQHAIGYVRACRLFREYTAAQIGLVLFHVEGAHLDRCLGSTALAGLDLGAKLVNYARKRVIK